MNYKLNTELIKSKMLQKGYSITKLALISQISKSLNIDTKDITL